MVPYRRIDRASSEWAHCIPLVLLALMALMFVPSENIAALETQEEGEAPEEVESRLSSGDRAGQDNKSLIQSKGTFAKLWNEQSFIGPGVLAVSEVSLEDPTNRLPGDFEKHGAVLVAGGWIAREAPDVLVEVCRNVKPPTELVLLASSPAERDHAIQVLAERSLSLAKDRFLVVPTDTPWVRDYGPVFVCEATGTYHAFDAAYDKPGRDRDDAASRAIADAFGVATTATPLRWQGGNLLSNGEGLLLTTTQAINANIECGYNVETVTRFLNRRFGVRQIVVLEHLEGERTGHIDMTACFTSRDTVVVGAYDPSVDSKNAARLDRNAARLAGLETSNGRLKVVRVPMPSNQDDVWRSYTNVVFANGTVLVPVYPDVDHAGGEEALAIYRRLLPERKVVGIDASTMALHQGGLRCVTLYIPPGG